MRIGLLALAACSSGEKGDVPSTGLEPGSIDLSWTVGANGCDEAQVETIAVLLDGGGELGSFACSADSGTVDVDAGTFDLVLRGRDAGGADRYGASVADVTVSPGQSTSVGSVLLSALPAQLTVNWHFDNGYLCAQNDVATVDVNLFDEDDYLAQTVESACDDGTAVLSDVTSGDWSVDVQGKDDAGNVGWQATQPVTVDKGATATVNVELTSSY